MGLIEFLFNNDISFIIVNHDMILMNRLWGCGMSEKSLMYSPIIFLFTSNPEVFKPWDYFFTSKNCCTLQLHAAVLTALLEGTSHACMGLQYTVETRKEKAHKGATPLATQICRRRDMVTLVKGHFPQEKSALLSVAPKA